MFIFGASGHAKVIISTLESQQRVVSGVFDDTPAGRNCMGYPVLPWEAALVHTEQIIIAIGDNSLREKVAKRLGNTLNYGRLVHSRAFVSNHAQPIGEGTVIMAGAVIQPDAQVGRHVIINTSASVDHDCIIADFVHIAPNAVLCGGVSVGHGTLIGAGSTVVPWITIGAGCVVGAGSTVLRNLEDGETVFGVVK